MSVGAVTFRSTLAGNIPARRFTPRHLRGTTPAIARTAVSRAALRRMALLLVGRASPLPVLALTAGWIYWNKFVEPAGFPGFDNIGEAWRKPTIGDTYSPGDYVPNPFDFHDNPDNLPESLLDTDDVVAFTIRYWGDFGADPYPTPVPALNWPTLPQAIPEAGVEPSQGGGNRRRRLLPNIFIGMNDLIDVETFDNVWIDIKIPNRVLPVNAPASAAAARDFQALRSRGKNAPRRKSVERKLRPKNMFIFWVIKKMINAVGEFTEYVDILAEAADYKTWRRNMFIRAPVRDRPLDLSRQPWWWKKPGVTPRSGRIPEKFGPEGRRLDTGRAPASISDGRHEKLLKIWYLFEGGGLNSIDYDLLGQLIIENELEDLVFGGLGRMSKSAAINLDMLLGPQTGQVL